MRVASLIDSLAPGGAERSLATLAPELRARGVDIEVAYLGRDATLAPLFESTGTPVRALDGRGRLDNVRRVRRWLRTVAPDVVHTTLYEADQAGRIAASSLRLPVVSSLVNLAYGEEQLTDPRLKPWKVRAAQTLDRLTARRVRRFHAITATVADTMAARLRVPRHLIEVIPRGRPAAGLGTRTVARREAARARLGIDFEVPLVVAAARHEHQKGLDRLVEAAPRLGREIPGIRVMIAGRRGNASADLEHRIRDLGLDGAVELLGHRDDVPDLLVAADVFVLPSRWEGLGSVLLEAMALEVPIVASDLPAVREVVDDASALLVSEPTGERLAGAVAATLADPGTAAARASTARARFLDEFEIARVADATVAFYERALGR